MNIKYIALLSLTLVAGVNAESTAEKLDRAKREFNECKQSKWRFSCDAEKQAFLETREEFLAPHRKNIEEGRPAAVELTKEFEQAERSWFFEDRLKKASYNKHKDLALKSWASEEIIIAFERDKDYFMTLTPFVDSKQTTIEFCDTVINRCMLDRTDTFVHEDIEQIRKALKQEMTAQ